MGLLLKPFSLVTTHTRAGAPDLLLALDRGLGPYSALRIFCAIPPGGKNRATTHAKGVGRMSTQNIIWIVVVVVIVIVVLVLLGVI
jgi:hypothetical protein